MTIKQALRDLASIEKRRGELEKKKASLDVFTIDQEINDNDTALQAQQALIADLERETAEKKLAAHRKKQCALVAELAALAGELDRLQAEAEKLAGEADDIARPVRASKVDPLYAMVDVDIMRDIAALCYREAVDIRYFEKSFKIRAKNLNYGC